MDELEQRLSEFETPAKHIGSILFDLDNNALPCGFVEIERRKYLRQGKPDLVVCAARPGVGKTALALQLGRNVASRVGPVMFFSLEMDERQLKQRLYALESETSINKLSYLSQSKRESVDAQLSSIPLYIDDTNNLDINLMMSRAIDFNKRRKLALVIVDYVQIIGTKTNRTKAEEVAEIAMKLKNLAKDLGCPVLTLAQMNRNSESRMQYQKDVRPMMSDLADSAGIEKWSDVIFFLHRQYLIDRARPGEVDVTVVKNRHGDTVDFKLAFSGELTKFYDMKTDEERL